MPSVQEQSRLSDGIQKVIASIRSAVTESRRMAVIMIFLDNMDRICATAGHVRAGEAVNEFLERLDGLKRGRDVVIQLSDRKFVLLLTDFRNQGHVQLAAQKIQRLIEKASRSNLEDKALQVSMGITVVSEDNNDAQEILRSAEIALMDGRSSNQTVSFYQEQAAGRFRTEWNLERKLVRALAEGNLDLHYQPKIDLDSKEVVGVEALIRWHDQELGDISPEIFIGVAERSGLITELTYFSIQRACRQLSEWRDTAPGMTIAVNTTPSTIRDREIVDVLEIATRIWNVDPGSILLEVTENALMVDPKTSHGILTAIRKFGAGVSIDDFGTGYSSLAYLKEIPADELKIDRSFVTNMLLDPGDYKIVEHATSLAKIFELNVVAEGVLNLEMMNVLWALGCDYAQGYFICEPLPADQFLAWYQELEGRWKPD